MCAKELTVMDLERQTIIPKIMLVIGRLIQNITGYVNIYAV